MRFRFRIAVTPPIEIKSECASHGLTVAIVSGLTRACDPLSYKDRVGPVFRGIFPVRSLVATLLTGLLLACPFLCGADEVGHSARHDASSGDSGKDHAPDQCPEGSDNCVCRGAVQASDVRADAQETIASGPFVVLVPPLHFAHPLYHLTLDGSPTGLASWGDSLTIRALLQNFRC